MDIQSMTLIQALEADICAKSDLSVEVKERIASMLAAALEAAGIPVNTKLEDMTAEHGQKMAAIQPHLERIARFAAANS